MRKILSTILLSVASYATFGQCPTGNHTGNITISSNCTISSSLTVTGNVTLTNSATLTVDPAVILTITGNLETGYQQGAININGGGTINAGGRFHNRVFNITSCTFSNITVTVNNSTFVHALNEYTSTMSLLNGTTFTVVQGDFENDDQANLTINNSSLIVTNGDFRNDDNADLVVENGGAITLNSGNFATEDASSFTVNASDIYINGDFNNDYNATLDVSNGSTFEVTGDFNNGFAPNGDPVNNGFINISDSGLKIGGDLNSYYGSNILIDDGGTLEVAEDVNNGNGSTIDIEDGGFSVGGTYTGDAPIGADAGGNCSGGSGCCGSGCAALPVSLTFFDAKDIFGHVELTWETASEKDNNYFNIHRSQDGVSFSVQDQIAGQGTTNEITLYEWTDYAVKTGTYYYKLEQVDYDGANEFFDVKRVDVGGSVQKSLSTYPVPVSSNRDFYVQRGTLDSESLHAVLIDLSGQRQYQLSHSVEFDRIQFHSSQLSLATGIYLVKVTSASQEYVSKIVVR